MPKSNAAAVEAFVASPAIALAGASRSGRKFGNVALRELLAKGYRIYPVHPSARVVDGVTCYADLSSLPEPVESLLVIVPPSEAIGLVRRAADAGIRRVWLQQGAESPEVLEACRTAGLETIAGECILMYARPTGIHRVHRWLWSILGRIPAAPDCSLPERRS